MGFWKNVESEMEYQGISRKELASKAGISYSGIGLGIERDSMPGADTALKISQVLNVPIDELLEGRKEIWTSDEDTALEYKFETLRDDMSRLPDDVRDCFFDAIHRMTDAYRRK